MLLTDKYITYISTVRRYSPRTVSIYSEILKDFSEYADAHSEDELLSSLSPTIVRSYEVYLLDSRSESPRTVNLHLSVLSGFCRFLIRQGVLKANPIRTVPRPKTEKRLPVFYRDESMEEYFSRTESDASEENLELIRGKDEVSLEIYSRRLGRLIVSLLFSTGIRRAELVGLTVGSFDAERHTLKVHGKGDKMREIPLVSSLCKEISLYLRAVETMEDRNRSAQEPLLVTPKGGKLYPMFIDRVIKSELGQVASITGRKSPHVLRHSLATELLNEGADLNSIKELLGHSSLAATQVYTHNSFEKLKKVYVNAHPRAKSGGKNGDQS